jgi:hypothetical protein
MSLVHSRGWFCLGICIVCSMSNIGCGGSDDPAGGDRTRGNNSSSNANGTAGTSLLPSAGTQPWSGNLGGGSGFGGSVLPSPQGGSSSALGSMECASALITTNKNMPSIVFVIDGSGSMCNNFGGSSRWQALRSALLDPMKGLVYRLQGSVSFGATLYDGTIDLLLALTGGAGMGMGGNGCEVQYAAMKDMGNCPGLVEVMPPKLNNAMAIDMAYPALELGGSTPTDKAMKHVMDALIASRQPQAPDQKAQNPVYVILATDGAPNDICVGGVGGDGSAQRQGVITSVDQGAAAGIVTWVISLAGNDAALQMHLSEVAKHGDPSNPMARTFSPMNPDDLIMTLAKLLGGAIGCNIALSGKVTVGQECLGTVEQNGKALPCCQQAAGGGAWTCNKMPVASPNGWRLSDDHSIELVGDACTNFLIGSGDLLRASFPCAVFVPS